MLYLSIFPSSPYTGRANLVSYRYHPFFCISAISSITPETGEFEHQNEIHAILTALDLLHHPREFRSTLDILAGEALVRKLGNDGHILIFGIFPQFVFLRVQAIPVHLYRRGYTGVDVAFPLLLHSESPPGSRLRLSMFTMESVSICLTASSLSSTIRSDIVLP